MEMWCPDDIGRDSWDWVGPPAWGRACFNSPEWGGGSSPVKTEPPQIVLLLLLFRTRAERDECVCPQSPVLIGMGALDCKELFAIEGSEKLALLSFLLMLLLLLFCCSVVPLFRCSVVPLFRCSVVCLSFVVCRLSFVVCCRCFRDWFTTMGCVCPQTHHDDASH